MVTVTRSRGPDDRHHASSKLAGGPERRRQQVHVVDGLGRSQSLHDGQGVRPFRFG